MIRSARSNFPSTEKNGDHLPLQPGTCWKPTVAEEAGGGRPSGGGHGEVLEKSLRKYALCVKKRITLPQNRENDKKSVCSSLYLQYNARRNELTGTLSSSFYFHTQILLFFKGRIRFIPVGCKGLIPFLA